LRGSGQHWEKERIRLKQFITYLEKKCPLLLLFSGEEVVGLGFKAALLIRALHLLGERRLCQMAAALAFHGSNVSQFLIAPNHRQLTYQLSRRHALGNSHYRPYEETFQD